MNILKKALLGLRVIGMGNILRAIKNSRQRDRLDLRYPLPDPPPILEWPGALQSANAAPSGARFSFSSAELTIRFLAPDFLALAWDGQPLADSYAVQKKEWPEVATRLEQDSNGCRLSSNDYSIYISQDGSLRLFKIGGELIRQDETPRREGHGWRLLAPLPPEACIYGLGERAARLNLRPGAYRLWNRDTGGSYGPGADPLYICMPVYLCLHTAASYLIFYDNPSDGALTLGPAGTETVPADQSVSINGSFSALGVELSFKGGSLRYYLAIGSPETLMERFTALVGRPPLPPRWALGYAQSRWGYGSEAEMRRIYKGFQEYNLPVSVLYLDIDHLRGNRTLTPDLDRYPSLASFAQELAEKDVHLVAIVDPAIKAEEGFDLYDEGVKLGAFCKTPDGDIFQGVVWPGWAAYPDFTDPEARAWWGGLYERELRNGVQGFWHDMNEPSNFTAWGENTLPLCTRHSLEGKGGDHRQAHNLYGLQMDRAGYGGLRRLQPDRRPFILSRSGWVGMQRYAWSWTGDIETSWEIMRQTPACVMGLGLSGEPYGGPDIGGFSGAPSPELFVRWLQMASWLPFFRTHCSMGLPPREPWEFGEQLPNLRQALELRYRLLPYWYTLAWQSSQSGQPLVRPLFWDEPSNRELWEIDEAFLLGDALLVAPVCEDGKRKVNIHLPSGGWYELGKETLHYGRKSAEIEAPLERIPILARAGCILPMLEKNCLELHLYRPLQGQACQGLLYSDAGDGYGPYRLDRFSLQLLTGANYRFTWSDEGDFAWPYEKVSLVLHGFGEDQAYGRDIEPNISLLIP